MSSGDVAKKKKKDAAKRLRGKNRPKIVAADLFCGAGGLTNGLAKAGIDVRVGVDIDPACDDEAVPLICPTCQVSAQSVGAGDRLLLCMGLFSIFLAGAAATGVIVRHPT